MSKNPVLHARHAGDDEVADVAPPAGASTRAAVDNRTDAENATGAAVLPSPLLALAAGTTGGLAGLAAVYLVASRLAGTLAAVAAVVMIFAVTMAGPWVHARADTELGRVIAVALQAVAFGGALGGLVVMT